jgi:Outer membrane efflux protein
MVTTEPRELREPGEAALTDPIDQIVSAALARRPDVLTAYAAHEASLARLRAARAEFMPKIFLSATGSYASIHWTLQRFQVSASRRRPSMSPGHISGPWPRARSALLPNESKLRSKSEPSAIRCARLATRPRH